MTAPTAAFAITKETPIEEVNAHFFPSTKSVQGMAFELPSVVVARDGQHFTLRNGVNAQLEHEIEEWFSFEQEKDFPLGIQRLSPLIVAGRTIAVLDEKSIPTASDYIEHLGQRVLWQFSSTQIPMTPGSLPAVFEKNVWRNRRLWVTLPEK